MKSQADAQDATDAATADAARRQRAYQEQSHTLFQKSLNRADPDIIKRDITDQTAQRAALMAPSAPGATSIVPGMEDYGSAATRDARTTGQNKVFADLTTTGEARAALGGANDAFRNLAIDTQPNADRIGQVGSAIQAQNSLLPLAVGAAGRTSGGLRQVGSLMAGAGQLGTMATSPTIKSWFDTPAVSSAGYGPAP